jgi:flagellar assembly protein FliH
VARRIFKSSEIREISSRVLITPPQIRPKQPELEIEEEIEEIEEAEPVEAEDFEAEPEMVEDQGVVLDEAERLREEAHTEAERIKQSAEETAFKLMQKSNVDLRKAKEEAEGEVEKILSEAREEAERLKAEAKREAEEILAEARKNAYGEGREEGFKEGQEEVSRLIDRLHAVLNAASDKRQEILNRTEKQIIDLVILVARRVVKVISETEKKVVLENVKQALDKVKGETEIIIKVNTRDLDLTSRHKKQFIAAVESLKQVKVEEDSRVAPGGCVIETSFGDIDARIARQLDLIEERIRELVPVSG